MRQSSEVMAVPHSTLKNKYTDLAVVLVGPIQFAAYAALVSQCPTHLHIFGLV